MLPILFNTHLRSQFPRRNSSFIFPRPVSVRIWRDDYVFFFRDGSEKVTMKKSENLPSGCRKRYAGILSIIVN